MRFGVHLVAAGQMIAGEKIARVARRAEELGYDSLWVSDHIVFPSTHSPTPLTRTQAAALIPPSVARTLHRLARTRNKLSNWPCDHRPVSGTISAQLTLLGSVWWSV